MIEIVNVSRDWAIGRAGQLLIRIPADMRYFRETTAGKVCIMGSTTLESFPRMAPLKGRVNIVLIDDERKIRPESLAACRADREAGAATELCYVRSPEEALQKAAVYPKDDVFVIGGASIYRLLLPYCEKAYITKTFVTVPADRYFPNLDELPNWHIESASEVQEENGVKFSFDIYKRK